jgi:hypothetical protein
MSFTKHSDFFLFQRLERRRKDLMIRSNPTVGRECRSFGYKDRINRGPVGVAVGVARK